MTDFRVSDTYRKDTHHPAGHGYGRKTIAGKWTGERILMPSSLVVHSTNNSQKNTKIWNECTFIRDSPDISCHDVIGKDGTIYSILPASMVAWHAGECLPAWTNTRSIGIELHVSVGETPTQAQKDALAWRVQQYIKAYKLVAADIETHRKVALPHGRKSDPEGWLDSEFYAWRDALFTPAEPDWPALWGPYWPYTQQIADTGIAQRWRQEHAIKPLGEAVTDEYRDSIDRVWRTFRSGAVWYWNGTSGVFR